MYNCAVCKKWIHVRSAVKVREHLNNHKTYGQLKCEIECQQLHCSMKFPDVWRYVRHFSKKHTCDIDGDCETPAIVPTDTVTNAINEGIEVYNEDDTDSINNSVDCENFDEIESVLKKKAVAFLVSIRAKGNIPHNASVTIIDYVSDLFKKLIDTTVTVIRKEFRNVLDVNVIQAKVDNISENLNKCSDVFKPFDSEFKIQKLYEMNPLYNAPAPIVMGIRQEWTIDNCIQNVEDTAQYVSIKRTIENLFFDEKFAEFFGNNVKSLEGVYSCFQSGSRFKENQFFSDQNKIVILLQLFYDGLGISNPLRGQSALQNYGMFYFGILNLPPRFQAALNNIHLVAICNSIDLKKYGFDNIFSNVTSELKELEEVGMEINIPGRGLTRIFASLAQLTGDNLGMNEACGLITGFNGDYCCLLCYATKPEMQTYFLEKDFKLRTVEEYNKDLLILETTQQENYRGIKRKCKLNDLKNFHVIENWTNDCMHTVLEGIVPVVVGCVLYSLTSLKFITLELLNVKLLYLYSLIKVDKKNKPCQINKIHQPGKGFSPKLGAAEMWSLFRFLPLIISDCVNPVNPHWKLFISFQEIVDMVFAPELHESNLSLFEILYAEFLTSFKKIYPEVNIRPKFHFLVHFSSIVRKNGPMRLYWAMNYERLNGSIKIPSRVMNNFKNPALTLARRRQYVSLQSLMGGFVSESLDYGRSSLVSVNLSSYDYDDPLNELFTECSTEETPNFKQILVTDAVVVNGTEYKNGAFVIVDKDDNDLVFGKIDFIVSQNPNESMLSVILYETLYFDSHCFSYCVKKCDPPHIKLVKIKDLIDFHPLDGIKKEGNTFIRLKYFVRK